jgi:hypothetical protein
MRRSTLAFFFLAACALAGCRGDEQQVTQAAPAPPAPSAAPAPGTYVDSILPPEEEQRRFREGLADPGRLSGGAASRDALVRRFVRAVETGDTAAVRAMMVSRAEFAWLYYPESEFARPPRRTSPALLWFLTMEESEMGIGRLRARRGGRPLGFAGHACDPEPRVQGANRLWRGCRATARDPEGGGTTETRLFGAILERGGHFKFLSYQNDL